jgi:hypothetical protein
MDGTFFVTPIVFAQLYSMHVFIGGTMFTCAYFLLPDKTQATYVRMLQTLQQVSTIIRKGHTREVFILSSILNVTLTSVLMNLISNTEMSD